LEGAPPPAFEIWFTDEEIRDHRSILRADGAKQAKLSELLMDNGVIKAHEKFFVSLAHDESDVDITIAAFAAAIDQLQAS
jgi:glutamate-1-semialdehyde aminotransferase